MMTEKITWVGCEVGDYEIEQQLCEGPFSTVYLGKKLDGDHNLVFKLAKVDGKVGANELATGCFATEARATTIGSTIAIYPDAEQVLQLQFEKLQALLGQFGQSGLSGLSSFGLVVVDQFVSTDMFCYYTMEYLEGETMRQLIASRRISIQHLVSLLQSLHALQELGLDYHGDLKPENIIFTARGAVLIDLGYFGSIESLGSELRGCAITTPMYYPRLVPDDLFALGCIIWESILGQQPLHGGSERPERERSLIGPKLLELVADEELVGKYFLSPLLNIALPSAIRPDISVELEAFLLKLLRLKKMNDLDNALEYQGPSFSSYAEILSVLKLQSASVEALL